MGQAAMNADCPGWVRGETGTTSQRVAESRHQLPPQAQPEQSLDLQPWLMHMHALSVQWEEDSRRGNAKPAQLMVERTKGLLMMSVWIAFCRRKEQFCHLCDGFAGSQ